MQNSFGVSFNGRFRNELLNKPVFSSLGKARDTRAEALRAEKSRRVRGMTP